MHEQESRSELDEFRFPFEELIDDFDNQYSSDFHAPTSRGLQTELSGTFDERIRILGNAINEIDLEIGVRKDLHRYLQQSQKISRDWIAGKLLRFDTWQFGYKPSVDFRRTALEKELAGVYREARSERQRAFSDISSLKKERRGLLMEYKSLKAIGKAVQKPQKPEASDSESLGQNSAKNGHEPRD